MSIKLNDHDLNCYAIDNDTAVISVQNKSFLVDYSLLIDFLTRLAEVAAQVESSENNQNVTQGIIQRTQIHELH